MRRYFGEVEGKLTFEVGRSSGRGWSWHSKRTELIGHAATLKIAKSRAEAEVAPDKVSWKLSKCGHYHPHTGFTCRPWG